MAEDGKHADASLHLQKFRLYETRSNFYMIGRDKSRTLWRVLKINRAEPSELNIVEDPTSYTESECYDILKRVHEGNRSNGGLRFVTKCYGIAGFVKFLGPYYMLLITKRRKIGAICGHNVYAVSKSKMIPLPHSTMRSNMAYSKDENRYKKLLCTVDLTKDFFFSYSYNIMRSLQKNLCEGGTGQVLYETMFVWNEYLTRGIRNHLGSTMWTVALVYGFFKQARVTVLGKKFNLTLIARRSRHFAGTRYLKRGVNEKGRVANDVETEQIVFEDNDGGVPTQMSSVVQNRGSIPLFWSQESSWLNMKPDIILHKNQNYEATRLHFDNLVKRYGNPIIILNLIKTREKKPRETILRAEFAKAISYINKHLPEDSRLKFLHWDLHKHSRRKDINVLTLLTKVAAYALDLTGFFYCQVPPALQLQGALTQPILVKNNAGQWSSDSQYIRTHQAVGFQRDAIGNSDVSQIRIPEDILNDAESFFTKPPIFQNGVLRTNCIDCLDRTNVAQYAYGLTALGHQLHALGFIEVPKIDLDTPLADELMCFYERMGDTLALQYGGSAAHNKIFSERRGQWKATTQSQEIFRTIQRYYSNTYMDAEKQDAINVFLGHFQPQQGKPALWELDSDQHYSIGRRGHTFADENSRSFIKRSMSDGYILSQGGTSISACDAGEQASINSVLHATTCQKGDAQGLSESTPEISTREDEISYSRCNRVMPRSYIYTDNDLNFFNELKLDVSNCSNFLDSDWISSSGNSCDEETYERSSLINSPVETLLTENVNVCTTPDTTRDPSEISIEMAETAEASHSVRTDTSKFSQSFVDWVMHGSTFCY